MILLDTCALIRIAERQPMRPAALEAATRAVEGAGLAVSVASAWEVGLLATRTRRTGALFAGDGRSWFARAVAGLELSVIAVDDAVALEAAYLPGEFHYDPSDRWIVATARLKGLAILTSDGAMLNYARLGYVDAVAC